jgi:hypothetical protein
VLATKGWAVVKTGNAALSLLYRFSLARVRVNWTARTLEMVIRATFENTRNTPIPIRAVVMELYAGPRRSLIGTISHYPGSAGEIKAFSQSSIDLPFVMTPAQLLTLLSIYGKDLIKVAATAGAALLKGQKFSLGLNVELEAVGRIVSVENLQIPFTQTFRFGL